MTNIDKFEIAIQNNNISVIKKMLKNKNFNPRYDQDHAIYSACHYGKIDIVRLLLEDGRIDPTVDLNQAILEAYQYEYLDMVDLLWNDQRVKESLKKTTNKLYQILIKQDIEKKINEF